MNYRLVDQIRVTASDRRTCVRRKRGRHSATCRLRSFSLSGTGKLIRFEDERGSPADRHSICFLRHEDWKPDRTFVRVQKQKLGKTKDGLFRQYTLSGSSLTIFTHHAGYQRLHEGSSAGASLVRSFLSSVLKSPITTNLSKEEQETHLAMGLFDVKWRTTGTS